jgi:hypothetical protein
MRRAGAAAGAGAPGVYTAKDVRAGAAGSGPETGKPKNHSTAHLTDEYTRRDLFGVVRGKCNTVRRRCARVCASARRRRPARHTRDALSSSPWRKETPLLVARPLDGAARPRRRSATGASAS